MDIPHVQNMESSRGNDVPNQFIIETKDAIIFQSFSTVIAVKVIKDGNVQIYLDENDWDYSPTTGKYRNIFLDEKIDGTRKKIASGIYKLMDLNA